MVFSVCLSIALGVGHIFLPLLFFFFLSCFVFGGEGKKNWVSKKAYENKNKKSIGMIMRIRTALFCRYWTPYSACRISRAGLFNPCVSQDIIAFTSITTGRLFHYSAAWYSSRALSNTSLLHSPATNGDKDNLRVTKEKERDQSERAKITKKENHTVVAEFFPSAASASATMSATESSACSETMGTTSSPGLQGTAASTPFLASLPGAASHSRFGEPGRNAVFHTHEEAECSAMDEEGRAGTPSSSSFFPSSSPCTLSSFAEESHTSSSSEESNRCGLYLPPPLSPFGDGLYSIPSIEALETAAQMLYRDKPGSQTTPDSCSMHSFTEEGRSGGKAWSQEREHGSRIDAHEADAPHGEATGAAWETAALLERLIIACQRSKEQLALAKSAAVHYRRMELRGKRALDGQARALLKEATHIEEEWKRFVLHRRCRHSRHTGSTAKAKAGEVKNRKVDPIDKGMREDGEGEQGQKLENDKEKVEGMERDSEEDDDGVEEAREWWKRKRAEAIRRVLTSSDAGGRGRLGAQPATIVPFP